MIANFQGFQIRQKFRVGFCEGEEGLSVCQKPWLY